MFARQQHSVKQFIDSAECTSCVYCYFPPDDTQALTCRRNPPSADNTWPKVHPQDFCGEFLPFWE